MICTKTILQKVRQFAAEAHGEQKRKYTPEPYIVHPARVADLCAQYTEDITVLCAALLHDVLEDTPTTEAQIRDFLSPIMDPAKVDKTLKMVVELTDVYVWEKFKHLNRESRKAMERTRMETISADAQTIKYADILDNCKEIVKHDQHFAWVFLNECLKLMRVLKKGNETLRARTMDALDQNLLILRHSRGKPDLVP
jgi:(p)ppGpp synthase/HD superfamily hydrolase